MLLQIFHNNCLKIWHAVFIQGRFANDRQSRADVFAAVWVRGNHEAPRVFGFGYALKLLYHCNIPSFVDG